MSKSTQNLREKAENQLLDVAIPVEAGVVKSATIEELEEELSDDETEEE